MPLTLRRAAVAALVAVASVAVPSASAAPPGTPPPPAATPPADAVPGELLLRTAPGASAAALADAVGAGRPAVLPWRDDVWLLEVPAGTESAAVARLAGAPGVLWATPNRVLRASTIPDDPGFEAQWHLQRRAAGLFSANWEPVNGTEATGQGVTVAVLDTGVTESAEIRTIQGYDFIDGDTDASDPNGHGTHVAGTIAQTTGNGLGVAGVAPRASVLPVRVLDAAGAGTAAQLLSGMSFAVSRGADVLNLSLGGGEADPALCDAVTGATRAGSVVVAAAGNEAAPVAFPAACPGAVAVSASTLDGRLASYSNRGPEITLAAPGGDVAADANRDGYPDGILQFSVFDQQPGFYFLAGTSMAAPHVAGAAALVRQLRPGLPPAEVATVLTETALDLGPTGPDSSFGAGLLDVAAAIASLGVQLTGPGTPADSDPPPTTVAPTTQTGTAFTDGTLRLSGSDRWQTAAAISRSGWSGGAAVVFLASGERFPDALAATPPAQRNAAPLLLTAGCQLPAATADELVRLSPRRVVVLGGTAAICSAVVSEVAARTGAQTVRVAGADRFATAAALASDVPAGVEEVFLASGKEFPDALTGGTRAARAGTALLLTQPCELPAATADALRRLRPARVTVLGGPSAVCDAVLARAAVAAGSGVAVPTRRLAGADRFATAAAVARDGWDFSAVIGVANGLRFPDALAGGAYTAQLDGPLLLVQPDSLPTATRTALLDLRPSRVTIFGGTAVVSDGVRLELEPYATGR